MTNPQLAPPNNSLALASLVLGLIAVAIAFVGGITGASTPLSIILVLFIAGIPGLLSIIFGFVGISTANRLGGKRRGLAIWGVVLGFCPVLAFVLGTILSVFLNL